MAWRLGLPALRAALAGLAVMPVLACAQPDEVQFAEEYKLKAAFLFNFGKFVDWPAPAFAAPDASLRICLVGRDPFGASLRALEGKLQRGRPIAVVPIRSAAELPGCHMLYGDGEKDFAFAGISARTLGDLPVLTVTSSAGSEGWTVIRFVQHGGKLRWELNLDAARKANLKISAKLIEIAVSVVGSASP